MDLGQDTVLVTGGAGFIGAHLVERLVALGLRVRVLDDFSSGKKQNLTSVENQIEVFEGSILDRKMLDRASADCRCIFHLAAVVSVPRSILEPERVHEVNASGTLAVIEAAKTHGARVIFSSSASVYGEVACPIQIEDDELSPISPYGVQKYLGELYLRAYHRLHGLESFALRYFNVYGSRQDPNNPYSGVISIFCERVRCGQNLLIFGTGSQTRDYIHVDDVVAANVAAMSAPNADGSGLNIGTGRPTELNQLAATILEFYGNSSAIDYTDARKGDIAHSCAHVELAHRRIGFRSRIDVQDGLKSILAQAN